MMQTGTIDAERTRWQFIFPEGLREEYPRPNGDITVTTYSPKWCQGIVERFREFQRASEAYGMPAQPLPVQIQHVGIHGTGTPEERRRVGSIYDLAYIPKGRDIPAGVWALIEWTLEGVELIESGKFNCLSPTNSSYGVLSTGRKIPGDFLVEVSLVDVPFLESIGTAADFLPFDYIQYSGTRSTNNVTRAIPAVWFNISTENPVIARGAQYRSLPMENEEKVEIELSPEKVTPALVEALMDTEVAREKMRKMCREMMESDLDGLLEARGYMKREMAGPTLPEALSEAVNDSVDIVAQARAIEESVIGNEVKELVRSGRLLAGHVPDYVARRKVGDKVETLLRDWSLASVMQGVTGSTPREKVANPRLTEADIMATVEKELVSRGKAYSYAEHLKLAKSRIADAREKGLISEV